MSSGKSLIKKVRAPTKNTFRDLPSPQESWKILSEAIDQIFKRNASSLSFETLYHNGYSMVLKQCGDMLYKNVKQTISDRLVVCHQELLDNWGSQLRSTPNGRELNLSDKEQAFKFTRAVKQAWEEQNLCFSMISDILSYMQRTYVEPERLPSITDLGVSLFRDLVLRDPKLPIEPSLIEATVSQINYERDGYTIDKSLLFSITEMMSTIPSPSSDCVYVETFEPALISNSKVYYAQEWTKKFPIFSTTEYLRYVETRISEERQRILSYLWPESEQNLISSITGILLGDHMEQIIVNSSGLNNMIDRDSIEDLEILYRNILIVDSSLELLRKHLSEKIIQSGKMINSFESSRNTEINNNIGKHPDNSLYTKWVNDILSLKKKYDEILVKAFMKDKQVEGSITRAFETFINQQSKAPEFISLYMDDALRQKGKSEEEITEVLQSTVEIFRFLSEKDIFEDYYKIHLAKRMLYGKSVSDDAERNMINMLKLEIGVSFTNKLEGMLKDMKVSTDLISSFKTFNADEKLSVDLIPTILTSTFWPISILGDSDSSCILPLEVEESRKRFEKFYLNLYSGRVLSWKMNLGTAEIKATFAKRKHELVVSTFSMVILSLFNDTPDGSSLSYTDIKNATLIHDGHLKRNLQSLACGKYRILSKTPKSREVGETDLFSFNSQFSAPLAKIKIAVVAAAANRTETDIERSKTLSKLDDARKHQIEASIVRIMKARKSLDHNNLIAEVTKQLIPRFSPSPSLIKRRIEALIEREYLERQVDNRNVYNYVA